MNFGKYKFEQKKKETQAKKKSHGMELKELRLGRSIMVEKHDIEVKLKKARQFLTKGHRLQVFLQLRGREIAHADIGVERLKEFAVALEDLAKIDMPARRDRRRITMLLAPLPNVGKKKESKKKDTKPAEEAPVATEAAPVEPAADAPAAAEAAPEESSEA
jgi:translation initiation factor IF-3